MTDFHQRHNNIATNPVKENGIEPGQIIRRKQNGDLEYLHDDLTVEEPLEIRIGRKTVATTMRTPGSDEELAAGFLVSEGIIRTPEQIANFSRPAAARNRDDIIITTLTEGTQVKLDSVQRFGTISSSCGICGKESIGAIRQNFPVIESAKDIRIDLKHCFYYRRYYAKDESGFARTGGIHAAGIFDLMELALRSRRHWPA